MEKFTKVKNIGKGNMGACALARNNEDGRYYVIKQVDLAKLNKKERQQSLNEAKVLSALRHPNIINYYDSFLARKSDHLCIVMEFADGGDLSQRIKNNHGINFSEPQVLDWLIQTALSLNYVHQRKILHRDVKTQNIFLTQDNLCKLGDFGIARTLSSTFDQANTFVGTPYYLSPELILERPYDHMSDVWALGIVLYEMMALKHPFNANDMKSLMHRILKVQYEPPPTMYSSDLRSIVAKILVKDPMQRLRLTDMLEMPIIHRRLRQWVDGGVLPGKYVTALLRSKALPSSIMTYAVQHANPQQGSYESGASSPSHAQAQPTYVPPTSIAPPPPPPAQHQPPQPPQHNHQTAQQPLQQIRGARGGGDYDQRGQAPAYDYYSASPGHHNGGGGYPPKPQQDYHAAPAYPARASDAIVPHNQPNRSPEKQYNDNYRNEAQGGNMHNNKQDNYHAYYDNNSNKAPQAPISYSRRDQDEVSMRAGGGRNSVDNSENMFVRKPLQPQANLNRAAVGAINPGVNANGYRGPGPERGPELPPRSLPPVAGPNNGNNNGGGGVYRAYQAQQDFNAPRGNLAPVVVHGQGGIAPLRPTGMGMAYNNHYTGQGVAAAIHGHRGSIQNNQIQQHNNDIQAMLQRAAQERAQRQRMLR